MAKAKFYHGTKEKIEAKAIEEGVFYVSTDTNELFVDIAGERKNLSTDNISWSAITGKPSTFPPSSHTHNYAGSTSAGGSATSAVKLDTSAGSTTQPVYFSGGKPTAIGYTINTSVPSGAKFTDTTYTTMKGATASVAGTSGLVPVPAAGKQTSFLRGDGTWVVPTNTTYSVVSTTANGLAPKLPGNTTTYLRGDGTWGTPPNTTYTLSSFGITATAAELNFCDGVTSNIQTQLNAKAASSHTHSYLPLTGGTLTGRVAANGKLSIPSTGGNWITGMTTTNASIQISTTNTSGSYHPIIAGTTYAGNFWNLGTITESVGFYGFKKGRTENATDWSFQINASTGAVTSTGTISAPTFSGNATTATALTSSAGSATQPVYFSGGKPVSCTYTLGKSVPSNAVFTDTNTTYSAASGGGLSLSGTAFSIASSGVTNAKIAANAVTMAKLGTDVGTVAVQSATPTDSHVKLWVKI